MFGLSAFEIVVIVVVAILVFGERLPQVAAEFAGWIVKLKRSVTELRRESGIDREIDEVRRQVENAVPREVRRFDVERSVKEGVRTIEREVAQPVLQEIEQLHQAATSDRREPTALQPAVPLAPSVPSATPAESAPTTAPPAASDRHP